MQSSTTFITSINQVTTAAENLLKSAEADQENNLARSSFTPFTSYVASMWPDKPEEFFAQSYAMWRTDPDYMKKHAKPLFEWFEKGGHLQ